MENIVECSGESSRAWVECINPMRGWLMWWQAKEVVDWKISRTQLHHLDAWITVHLHLFHVLNAQNSFSATCSLMGDLDRELNRRLGRELDTLGIDQGRTKCLSAGALQDCNLQQHVSTSGKPPASFTQRAR